MHRNALEEQWIRMTLLRLYLFTVKSREMNEKALVILPLVSTFYHNAGYFEYIKVAINRPSVALTFTVL